VDRVEGGVGRGRAYFAAEDGEGFGLLVVHV
jgi:hypothetical protein